GIPYDVQGAGHRICRYRQTAGHGLQQHQSERVRLAREHEDVRGSVYLRQLVLVEQPEIVHFRVPRLDSLQCGSHACNPLRAWQIQLEESFDVLLDRHPADVEEDRRLAIEPLTALGLEDVKIYAA